MVRTCAALRRAGPIAGWWTAGRPRWWWRSAAAGRARWPSLPPFRRCPRDAYAGEGVVLSSFVRSRRLVGASPPRCLAAMRDASAGGGPQAVPTPRQQQKRSKEAVFHKPPEAPPRPYAAGRRRRRRRRRKWVKKDEGRSRRLRRVKCRLARANATAPQAAPLAVRASQRRRRTRSPWTMAGVSTRRKAVQRCTWLGYTTYTRSFFSRRRQRRCRPDAARDLRAPPAPAARTPLGCARRPRAVRGRARTAQTH